MKSATCHPDRAHKALGLCLQCYNAQAYARRAHEILPAARERAKQRHASDPGAWAERCRRSRLKHQFGITPEQYDVLLAAQDGACALCRRAPKKRRLAVDHDHTTGVVRGLLCTPCNYYVMWAADADAEFVSRLVAYRDRGQTCP